MSLVLFLLIRLLGHSPLMCPRRLKALTPEADLSITKDDDTDRSVLGRESVYTITAFNPGPSDVPGATVENTATVSCPASVTERNPADNLATDTNTLWEEIFSDGFESGNTGGWS